MRINREQRIILGMPGTGKTTTLLNNVEKLLKDGVPPERIAFVSFTRKAVLEAIDRAHTRFGLSKDRFVYFKTIHALCYKMLDVRKGQMIDEKDLTELGNILGYNLRPRFNNVDMEILFEDDSLGTQLYFLDTLSRIMCVDHNKARLISGVRATLKEIEHFSESYLSYKESRGKIDFTDLLEIYYNHNCPVDVDYFFVDEAQDLAASQWRVLEVAASSAKEAIICGDDDQSIFKWSGADINTFLHLEGPKTVLNKSWRLPAAIQDTAMNLISQVSERYDKKFEHNEKEGSIHTVNTLEDIEINEKETTLILVRNTYLLDKVYAFLTDETLKFVMHGQRNSVEEDHMKAIVLWERLRKGEALRIDHARHIYQYLRVGGILERGGKAALLKETNDSELLTFETLRDCYGLKEMPIWYEALDGITQHKRDYYLAILRKGERLNKSADIRVTTIHSIKGGEADHVVILSDMAKRTFDGMNTDKDSELRVAYVALTRAKKRVTIVKPTGKFFFDYRI